MIKKKNTFIFLTLWKLQKASFTSPNDNVPGKCICIANFIDRFRQNLEVVWFFLEIKPASLKNQWLLFIHQFVSPLLWKFSKDRRLSFVIFELYSENLIDLSCQTLCISLMLLWIKTNFFHSYWLRFLIKASIDRFNALNSVERRNMKCYCSTLIG